MKYAPNFISPETDVSLDHIAPEEAHLLWEQSHEKLAQRLSKLTPAAPEATYLNRLENELNIIKEKKASGYFLIVADYVNWARTNGIAVGPGRGSGPCSLVAFALGITQVDPIKYHLPFERFLNPDRNSGPDFDLEFCEKRRAEVLNYIQSKYGVDQVAHISSDHATPLLSRLVIGDRPLAQVIPLRPKSDSAFQTTEMTLKKISNAGLVQFNVINQSALSQIQGSLQLLSKKGVSIDLENIPLDDEATYNLLCTGQVSNIPILDGMNYKTTLTTVQPRRFEELCAVIAMHQPHFQQNIPLYIARKQTQRTTLRAIEHITQETYGLILYQEQIIHIAHAIAGFTLAQGDELRRVLRDSNQEAIADYKSSFLSGTNHLKKVSSSEAIKIFGAMSAAGPTCYNKSHAVSFAMIAYQTAWLKTRAQSDE